MLRSYSRSWWMVAHLVILLAATKAMAGPPLISLLPFKKVDADPKKAYKLGKSNGPWMIMAISLSGDDRVELAQKLVLELRRDHKLEAWMHEQQFNNGEPTIGLGVNAKGDPKRMKNLHGGAASEVAVLVGNFKSADDPDAVRMRDKLRSAKIKCLSHGEKFSDNTGLNAIRDKYFLASRGQRATTLGPLRRAFVTRNPLTPADDVARETLDPFVVELNRGLDFSLLENPAQYTVVIGTFRGAAAYSETDYVGTVKKGLERHGDSPIDKAAKDAALAVAELRKKGEEAYVFHDRHESLVTIGSFNEIGTEMLDGHVELSSGIVKVIKTWEAQKADPRALQSKRSPAPLPTNNLALIPRTVQVVADGKKYSVTMDVSPRIILVPRQSIADVYRER